MTGQRKALIVANDEYEQEALRNLLAPAADAEALGRVLGDQQIGDFSVQVVRNEPAHVIQAHIEELFSESRPDDVLLLHFSGHGLKSESGELFFAASNTRPNRLGSTAVPADFVQRCMRAARSRSVVLLLDCCYGGAFAQGVTVRAAGDVHVLDSFPQERTGGRGRAVITASGAMEYAFEGDRLADDQHRRASVFTGALVEGLATGDADRDEDGWVSLNELYDYVFDKVREQNPHQTPSRQVELEGELYLARSRRRRIRPAPLPPDLQAAVTDPNMFTRLGAVSELTARLTSDNLPTAAGAYEALADLARTDIRSVADPAGAALSQAAVHPDATELHFGRIEQGSAPPHRTVRLLGPPIARACAPRASHDWVRVNQTDEGFDISVDTATAGILRGTVDVKGATGEAIIAIDVELLPASSEEQARREAEQAAQQEADEQARREAEQAAQREAEQAAHGRAAAANEPQTAPQQTAPPAAPAESQPPIRRGLAYAGSVIALLGGVAALISEILYNGPGEPGGQQFFNITGAAVFIAAATAALLRINRLVIIGFLQGMLWLAVTYLAYDIALASHLHGQPGHLLTAYWAGVAADVLGVIAAVLLMISWSPALGRPRTPRLGALPAALLCAVGLSQIAQFIFELRAFESFTAINSAINAEHITAILVGLAVTWYALSLRARPPGGALILGWATVTLMFFLADTAFVWANSYSSGETRTLTIIVCVLLAIVVILTVIYLRRPADPQASPPEQWRGLAVVRTDRGNGGH